MAAGRIECIAREGDARRSRSCTLLRPPPTIKIASHACALILASACVTLAGPARAAFDWWPFGKKADEIAQIPDPVEYEPKLTVDGGTRAVEKSLREVSALIDRRKTPTSGVAGLIARARQDVGQLTAILYQHAYYAGQIAITIDGKPLNAISPFDPVATKPVPVEIHVITGERFAFGKVEVPALPRGASLSRLGLVPGRPADSGRIVAAENVIADAWREQGHPLVTIKPREVVADHDTHKVDVKLDIEAGPVARYGRDATAAGASFVEIQNAMLFASLGQRPDA